MKTCSFQIDPFVLAGTNTVVKNASKSRSKNFHSRMAPKKDALRISRPQSTRFFLLLTSRDEGSKKRDGCMLIRFYKKYSNNSSACNQETINNN